MGRPRRTARPFAAVVLAAGAGLRFGGSKALMRLGERTALEVIVEVCRRAGAAQVVVATGHHRDAVSPLVAVCGALEAINQHPERGMMSSVRAGVAAARIGLDLLVWPVDHPFVSVETVLALSGTPAGAAVVPTCGGRGGHPVLLPSAWRETVLALDDRGGLDRVFRERRHEVVRLEVADPGVLRDVDTPADLEA